MNWPFGLLRPARYGVIMTDVPHHYKAYSDEMSGVPQRGQEIHYDTMKMEEIAALPVWKLAAPDCALFFWSTSSHLPQSLYIIGKWGFNFASKAFCWAKLKRRFEDIADDWNDPRKIDIWHMGLGYGTRRNTEDCWLATRGAPKRLDMGVRELIVAPVRDHSRKPDEAYSRAQRLYGGPYCELFSRESRKGWSVWGNETGKFDE